MNSIGNRFKEIREILGFKQNDFGKIFELSQDSISSIERNKIKPNFKVLEILGDEYKVNLNWLILGKGNKFLESHEDNDIQHLKHEIEQLDKRVTKLEHKDV